MRGIKQPRSGLLLLDKSSLQPESPNPKIERARSLRQAQTPPERLLWSRLRGRRLHNFKFRRQQPIGPFTVDFYCAEAKLVVEVDGARHGTRRKQDDARDQRMESEGIMVHRVTVSFLMSDTDAVLTTILRLLQERTGQHKG